MNEKTGPDSIREYYTGAAADGLPIYLPELSIGGYRSSIELPSYGILYTPGYSIRYVTIDHASGENTEGEGTLEATDVSLLRWKDAGGTFGPEEEILNGDTKILQTGGSPTKFIRVTRHSSFDLTPASVSVFLSRQIHNALSGDEVTSAEALAGDTEYHATILKNESSNDVTLLNRWIDVLGTQQVSDGGRLGGSGAGTITTTGSFADWPATGWCHIRDNTGATREIVYYTARTNTVLTVPLAGRSRLGTSAAAGAADDTLDAVPGFAIGIDSTGVQSGGLAMQTIANENTSPAGVVWSVGLTSATGLSIGTLRSQEQVGIWTKREIPAGCVATTDAEVAVKTTFSAVTS